MSETCRCRWICRFVCSLIVPQPAFCNRKKPGVALMAAPVCQRPYAVVLSHGRNNRHPSAARPEKREWLTVIYGQQSWTRLTSSSSSRRWSRLIALASAIEDPGEANAKWVIYACKKAQGGCYEKGLGLCCRSARAMRIGTGGYRASDERRL